MAENYLGYMVTTSTVENNLIKQGLVISQNHNYLVLLFRDGTIDIGWNDEKVGIVSALMDTATYQWVRNECADRHLCQRYEDEQDEENLRNIPDDNHSTTEDFVFSQETQKVQDCRQVATKIYRMMTKQTVVGNRLFLARLLSNLSDNDLQLMTIAVDMAIVIYTTV
jgi:hypothetical protein